jgi:tetratricopeptide (TPR) repeat protein
VAAFCAVLAGCQRPSAPAPERLALLRFDDLSASDAHRWIERAIPEQLHVQLRGPGRTILLLPGDDVSGQRHQAVASGASRIVSGWFVVDDEGRLTVEAAVEFPAAPRQMRPLRATGTTRDIIGVTAAVARALDPAARPFTTDSTAALEQYCRGLLERNPQERRFRLQKAMELDPGFGLPYAAALQAASAAGDRAWANEVLERARSLAVRDEIDAARIGVEGASLAADRKLQADALGRLAGLLQDPALMARAAETRLRTGQVSAAVKLFERALELYPDNVEVLNQLAYAHAYGGKVASALEAAGRYRRLRPDDPNALDTRGDVLYLHNRYREAAADYREAFRINPDFADSIALYKAAFALLWDGDRDAADRTFAEYLRAREEKQDRQTPLRRAEWEYLSGRRAAALARLETALQGGALPPVLRAIGHAQAAFWRWDSGDLAPARAHAQAAGRLGAQSPIVALAAFATQSSPGPADWFRRADQWFAQQPRAAALRPTFLAVALLLHGHFAEAETPLREWTAQSFGQPGDPVPVYRAWALAQTGRWDEVPALVATTPLIPASGMPVLAYLGFPRLFQLRAEVARRAGREPEAQAQLRLWTRYRAFSN